MKQVSPFWRATGWVAGLVLCFGLFSGCGRSDIRVYNVPRENPEVEAAAEGPPHLHWKLPAGWEEREGDQMRLARFAVRGQNGEGADVSIISLGGTNAKKEELLNIWREQLKLPPLQGEQTNSAASIAIGPGHGELYEMVSEQPIMDEKKARTLLAMLTADDGGLWVFKMTGHADLVQQQKQQFEQFLKSISMEKAAPSAISPSASTNLKHVPGADESEPPKKPNWQVPAGWKEQPATQMLLAKFLLEDGGHTAEVTVTAFPGDAGGLLGNVNRWRVQIGLKAIAETELTKSVDSMDLAGTRATLVDMSGVNPKNGQKTRLIGAIVPRDGKTWFFKLMGDEQVAEKEKQTFVKFVQTIQFPDA